MTRPPSPVTRHALSLVGMLVTLVCILVLSVIGMSALNKAVTGEGSAVEGTVHSMQDQVSFYALYQSMAVHAGDHRGRFVTPSLYTEETADDTTANLFSLMVMQDYIQPAQLVSANEFSGYVEECETYDHLGYDPRGGVYWDPAFKADLARLSHVSYAHVPLIGERFEKHWLTPGSGRFPVLGNRGPKDGVDDPDSWTYGRNGVWGGQVVYGDGHIDFTDTFTPPAVFFEVGGERYADNLFAVEDGPLGRDAILAFTKAMSRNGAELQFD
ncbi:MAG: hypothetical protein HKO59_02540 [Phycisphaerales bacterium]|nr:hypothetical protein [Phycisphaerae bacterium]NNM24859.1 hypothetical protein [Phycisphaerales bacterium]